MTARIINRTKQETDDQHLLDGLKKHEAEHPSFFLGGVRVATPELIAALQARLDAARLSIGSQATWQTNLDRERAERAKSEPLLLNLRRALLAMFSGSLVTLGDFGLAPRKRRAPSAETVVLAGAKAKATRAARHTMGKKAKLKITGVAAPASPPAPPSPTSPTSPTSATSATSPTTPTTPTSATSPTSPSK